MSEYGDYNKVQIIKSFDTAEEILFGGFQLTENKELAHIIGHFYLEGALPTTETMQLKICSDEDGTVVLFSSNAVNLSDAEGITSRKFFTIRFDFSRQNINKNYRYYPKLVLTNYTRTAGYYIGALLDWPNQVNVNANNAFNRPIKYEVHGYTL